MDEDSSQDCVVVAYYCTGHGLGHATRVCQVCDELLRLSRQGVKENEEGNAKKKQREKEKVLVPPIKVIVISSLPEHVFLSAFQDHPCKDLFAYRNREPLDCGGIQEDAFVVKPQLTLETYKSLAGNEDRREKVVEEEVQWLLNNKVDFVCSDTVPLALRCAKVASISSAVISNLSWDFIYQHFLNVCQGPELCEYKAMVRMISEDYSMASLLLRLPGAHPMPAFDHITPSSLPLFPFDLTTAQLVPSSSSSSSFSSSSSPSPSLPVKEESSFTPTPSVVVDVPFVVRRSRRSKEDVRRALGLTCGGTNEKLLNGKKQEETKLLLLVFGGQSGNVRWTPSMASLPDNWVCAVCHAVWDPNTLDELQLDVNLNLNQSNPPNKGKQRKQNRKGFLKLERDVYLPDLIAASDVVLGKIGYGSVSECVCHRTPLCYVSRKNFAEEHYLKEVMEKYNNCVEMSFQDFQSGNWSRTIQEAAQLKPTYHGHSDGGLKCAQTIVSWVQREKEREKQKQKKR